VKKHRRTAKLHANCVVKDIFLTNEELIELYSALVEAEDVPASPAFSHAVLSNLDILRPVVESVDAGFAPTEAYKAYDTARAELCRRYAKKDVDGKPIAINDAYVIGDHAGFRAAIEKLRGQYRDAIEDYESEASRLLQFLATEGPELSLHRVGLADCPVLSPIQMRGILPMIEPVAANTTSA